MTALREAVCRQIGALDDNTPILQSEEVELPGKQIYTLDLFLFLFAVSSRLFLHDLHTAGRDWSSTWDPIPSTH
jgi:hypothetical protein